MANGTRFRPIIRVFVSSTFSDLKAERNALARDVFPKLEHYCLLRGFQFEAIDLRWGVPGEAALDHRTMRICFDELRRAQEVSPRPNFLILLGDRYGWQPLAEWANEKEFVDLAWAAAEIDNECDRNSGDPGLASRILADWYRRDDNADPVEYVLRSRLDWPGHDAWDDEDAEKRAWETVEKTLWEIINRAWRTRNFDRRFVNPPEPHELLSSIVKFQASATEQEIWRGALAVPDAEKHVVAWYRTIRNRGEFEGDGRLRDFFDRDSGLGEHAATLRAELQRRLGQVGDNEHPPALVDLRESADGQSLEVTGDHLNSMCGEIEESLRKIIDEEISEYWRPGGGRDGNAASRESGPGTPTEGRKLELEQQTHERFGEERAPAPGFVGREDELAKIAAYLQDASDRKPLVVYGPSGTGKTAILARAAQIAREQRKDRVFLRFLGTTPQSSNLNALLTSLCRELRPAEEREKDLPVELRLLQDEFDRLLATATAEQPILLFLDAIDQLDEADGARQTYWLRVPLPEHVKAVVSCIRNEDTPEQPDKLNEPYRAFERRKLLEDSIEVASLTAAEAMRAIDLWLAHARAGEGTRILQAGQRRVVEARIRTSEACRRPLYLRVLAEEARQWPSWLEPERIVLGENIAELIGAMFTRLEDKAVHGPELVTAAMGYLVAARRGLSQNEMLEVLWADEDYRRHLEEQSRKTNHELPEGATRIPIALWSRLRHDLDPYLSERDAPGAVVIGIYHREVEFVVSKRFLAEGTPSVLRHQRLAEFFLPSRPEASARRLEELPWQCVKARMFDDLRKVLTDIDMFIGLSDRNRYEIWDYWQAMPVDSASFVEEYDQAVVRWREQLGETPRFELALNELEHFLLISGDNGASSKYARLSYRLAQGLYPEDDIRLAIRTNNLSTALYNEGKFAESLELVLKAKPIYEKEFEPTDYSRWTVLNNLAMCLLRLGRLEEAETTMRSVLAEEIRYFGRNHTGTLTSTENFARILQCRGKFAEATELFEQGAAGRCLVLGDASPMTLAAKEMLEEHTRDFIEETDPITVLINLANYLKALGINDEAIRRYDEALVAMENNGTPADDAGLVLCARNLSVLLEDRHDAKAARKAAAKLLAGELGRPERRERTGMALSVSEAAAAFTHASPYSAVAPNEPAGCQDLAEFFSENGRPDIAVPLRQAAVRALRSKLGSDHSQTVDALNEFRAPLTTWGLGEIEISARVREANSASDEPEGTVETAVFLNNRGLQLRDVGHLIEAESLLRIALRIDKKLQSSNYAIIVHRLVNLATVLVLQFKCEEATRLLREAWNLQSDVPDLNSARVLFVRLVVALLQSEAPGPFVGRLKTLLTLPSLPNSAHVAPKWKVFTFIKVLESKLSNSEAKLLYSLVAAIHDRSKIVELDQHTLWRDQVAIAVEASWL
jgi:tetratricopeptide (TPR) repeat protein